MNAYTGPLAHQAWPEASAAGCVGHLDRVDPDGVIEGWCWRPDAPAARTSIVVQVDGVPMASARCDSMRPDLLARGIGDGAYGFLVVLPDAALRVGHPASVTLHDAETGRALDGPQTLSASPAERPTPLATLTQMIEGNLDGVSSEGIVTGWCWRPMQPTSPVSVTIAVDGHVIGTVRADTMRPDLLRAGIGHGAHGFSLALPWALLEASGIMTVAAADAATGQGFGVPCVANPGKLSATHERIADLQHEIRRLTADLAAIAATIADREATAPTHSLFATLGAVFTNLAAEHAASTHGNSRAIQPQASDIAAIPRQILCLAIAATPRATIIVFATADLDVLTGCLQSLHHHEIDQHADIVVMTAKATYDDTAMLHATIGNLHLVENRSTHLADALARFSRPGTPVIVLAPIVRLDFDCFDQLIATAARHPEAGIVGGRVVGAHDGLLRHCALDIDHHGLPIPTGAFQAADKAPNRHLRRVEAVGGMSFIASAQAIANLRRQPACIHAPSCPGDDALDICLRVRQSGLDVLVQPTASAICPDAADLSPYVPDLPRAPQQHREAWAARPAFRTATAKALLIVDSIPPEPDNAIVTRLAALRALGADIMFAVTKPVLPPLSNTIWVEARGACVLNPSNGGSIGAYLQSVGHTIDVVEFLSENPPAGLVQRVRALTPRAMTIGNQTAPSHQKLSRNDRTRLSFLTRQHPAPATFHDRQGIALVADFANPGSQKCLQWLVSDILPALYATHPTLRFHVIAIGHSKPVAAKIVGPSTPFLQLHRFSSASLQGLCAMRLAVIPSQQTGPNEAQDGRNLGTQSGPRPRITAEAALCLAAGLPLISRSVAMPPEQFGENKAPAVTTTEDFIRTILALHDNPAEWARHSTVAIAQCRSEFTPQAASSLYRNFVEYGIGP